MYDYTYDTDYENKLPDNATRYVNVWRNQGQNDSTCWKNTKQYIRDIMILRDIYIERVISLNIIIQGIQYIGIYNW